MNYISIKEAAAQWGVTIQMVRLYCQQGMIPQVIQENGEWRIPKGTQNPEAEDLYRTKKSSVSFAQRQMTSLMRIPHEIAHRDRQACAVISAVLHWAPPWDSPGHR
jgi:hypothetical protein